MHTPSFEGVVDAARQIAPAAVRTPLIEHPALNEAVGGRVLMKAETFQVAGAFKFRGAYNRIRRLSAEEKKRGVVACSSGNHAQGVAAAAKILADCGQEASALELLKERNFPGSTALLNATPAALRGAPAFGDALPLRESREEAICCTLHIHSTSKVCRCWSTLPRRIGAYGHALPGENTRIRRFDKYALARLNT
jgi:hypothetical protein